MVFFWGGCWGAASIHASVNVPLGSAFYDDLDILEVKGLVPSSMLSTRPLSRREAARVIWEARERLRENQGKGSMGAIQAPLRRLESAFKGELSAGEDATYLKPVDTLYAKLLYAGDARPFFAGINNNGDASSKGYNFRGGFSLRGQLWDSVSFYLNPEYRLDKDASGVKLATGYLDLDLWGVELEAGRDSMWWGPGRRGDLILTNNAEPLDMIKLTTERPVPLPWIFSYLGILKPTVFLTHLEKNRDFPRANVLGMRLDFKPTGNFQFAFNRVFQFGGHGKPTPTASGWVKAFFAVDSYEHSRSVAAKGNQIASIDASYVFVNESGSAWFPFSGIKLYTEWGAEDSAGDMTPTGRADVEGIYVDEPMWIRSTDFRVEWASTAHNLRYANAWYTHSVYTTGYTYNGRVIGHSIGTDARDLFLRFQRHTEGGTTFGAEADFEVSGYDNRALFNTDPVFRRWYGADVMYPLSETASVTAAAGVEDIKNNPGRGRVTNPVTWLRFDWRP